MKTTITTFEFPKAAIRISNLEIDVEKRKASFTLGIKDRKGRMVGGIFVKESDIYN